jgi:hypothetical protein
VTFSLVVTASQFIGDPIDCIVTKDVPANMMDTYCWSVQRAIQVLSFF